VSVSFHLWINHSIDTSCHFLCALYLSHSLQKQLLVFNFKLLISVVNAKDTGPKGMTGKHETVQ